MAVKFKLTAYDILFMTLTLLLLAHTLLLSKADGDNINPAFINEVYETHTSEASFSEDVISLPEGPQEKL